ncbi:MAG: DUF1854 domain-containing protein [Eubacteriales bacterium]
MEDIGKIVDITYFTPENAQFSRTEGGFPALRAFIPKRSEDDLSEADTLSREPEWQDLGRVFLHRAFPYDMPEKYISVLDKDGKEYGMIRSIDDFGEDVRELLRAELSRKYYAPVITKINSLTQKFGYTYWEADTDVGKVSFAMHDTFRNIAKVGGNRLMLTDVDGNRFEIKDYLALDRKSFRRIELYL